MKPSEIGWSRYKDFEGPFSRGTVPYSMPSDPNPSDRIMAVITATEGGRWNAVNMYDVCIFTVGLIQWCEGSYYLVSDMLGEVFENDFRLLEPMAEVMEDSGVQFHKNSKGRYRFHFRDERGEVDRRQEQRQLYLLNSSGKRGTWDEASKLHARKWAASAVNLFAQPETLAIQREYTVRRLRGFALPFARGYINRAPDTEVGQAFVAAYLSYAANNPTWANNNLQAAVQATKAEEWTTDWLVDVLRQLTHGPRVHIYPHRYNAIRPVLESLYDVQLPDTAQLLQQDLEEFMPITQVQQILVALGYNLGPYGPNEDGIDGVYKKGGKTYQAIMDFQEAHGIEEDEEDQLGWVGDDTALALRAALAKLQQEQAQDPGAILSVNERRELRASVYIAVQEQIREYLGNQRPPV